MPTKPRTGPYGTPGLRARPVRRVGKHLAVAQLVVDGGGRIEVAASADGQERALAPFAEGARGNAVNYGRRNSRRAISPNGTIR